MISHKVFHSFHLSLLSVQTYLCRQITQGVCISLQRSKENLWCALKYSTAWRSLLNGFKDHLFTISWLIKLLVIIDMSITPFVGMYWDSIERGLLVMWWWCGKYPGRCSSYLRSNLNCHDNSHHHHCQHVEIDTTLNIHQ